MIFTNVSRLSAESKEMEFGTLNQICVGENGRGRKEIRLACPVDCELTRGCNFDYTIGLTKSERPRINKLNDNKVYLLLSAKGRYTRRGNGWIGGWVSNTATYKVLAKGNGADGDAGRIGWWDCLLLEVEGNPDNDWIRIRTGGGGYGTSPQWLNISSKGFFLFDETDDAIAFADSLGIDFPDIDNCNDIEDIFKDFNQIK